jgi:serine/threonine-protein kinase
MPLSPGTRLGAYEILGELGAGGMGEVYRARDTRLDRTVAIKVMPPNVAGDSQFRARFDREARAISQLQHPHICTLYDVGEVDGTAFLVMELLQGQTLADRLTKGALPLDEGLRIAIDIADALAAAHKQGIVHRDLKPANVMLTKAGAKLLDFGLAKAAAPVVGIGATSTQQTASTHLTGSGTILGTLHYMSPEQVEGREADARSDVFAFGTVVYELLTGKRAFDGDNPRPLLVGSSIGIRCL